MIATTICRDCRVIFPAQFALNERCPSCACKYLRQERRRQRTPESRSAILTEVYARLEVQADRGYRQIHSDDVEELLAEIERLRAVEAAARLALAANAELEHLRKIKAAAQRYIAASGDDLGPYSEEQQAWDALDEALTEACT